MCIKCTSTRRRADYLEALNACEPFVIYTRVDWDAPRESPLPEVSESDLDYHPDELSGAVDDYVDSLKED